MCIYSLISKGKNWGVLLLGESPYVNNLILYAQYFRIFIVLKYLMFHHHVTFIIISRRRYQVRTKFLFSIEGTERFGLPSGDRFRAVRAGQTGRTTAVPVGS